MAAAVDISQLPPDALLTRRQVATMICFHPQTLRVWAATGRGPHVTRLEGRVRYRVADVRDWMGLETCAA